MLKDLPVSLPEFRDLLDSLTKERASVKGMLEKKTEEIKEKTYYRQTIRKIRSYLFPETKNFQKILSSIKLNMIYILRPWIQKLIY